MIGPFEISVLSAYLLAAGALVLAPGPAQALVIARSVERGPAAGIVTVLGLDLATLVHTMAAALGLSALLAASATAFTIVKLAGAAYLVWLGVRTFRRAGMVTAAGSASPAADVSTVRLFVHGVVTGLLNPKVAVFFLAFLPQFVRPEHGSVLLQFVVLGALFALLDLVFCGALALVVGAARARLLASERFSRWRERVTGGVLVALGASLALQRR